MKWGNIKPGDVIAHAVAWLVINVSKQGTPLVERASWIDLTILMTMKDGTQRLVGTGAWSDQEVPSGYVRIAATHE